MRAVVKRTRLRMLRETYSRTVHLLQVHTPRRQIFSIVAPNFGCNAVLDPESQETPIWHRVSIKSKRELK
jgi:hypothetical protein